MTLLRRGHFLISWAFRALEARSLESLGIRTHFASSDPASLRDKHCLAIPVSASLCDKLCLAITVPAFLRDKHCLAPMQPATKQHGCKKSHLKGKTELAGPEFPPKSQKTLPGASPLASPRSWDVDAELLPDAELVDVDELPDLEPEAPVPTTNITSSVCSGTEDSTPGATSSNVSKLVLDPAVLALLTTAMSNSIGPAVKASIDALLPPAIMDSMAEATAELKAEMADTRNELKATIAALDERVQKLESSPFNSPNRSPVSGSPTGTGPSSPAPSYLAAAMQGACFEQMGTSPVPSFGGSAEAWSPSRAHGQSTLNMGYSPLSTTGGTFAASPLLQNLSRISPVLKDPQNLMSSRCPLSPWSPKKKQPKPFARRWQTVACHGKPAVRWKVFPSQKGTQSVFCFDPANGHRVVAQVLQHQQIDKMRWKEVWAVVRSGEQTQCHINADKSSKQKWWSGGHLKCFMKNFRKKSFNALTEKKESLKAAGTNRQSLLLVQSLLSSQMEGLSSSRLA